MGFCTKSFRRPSDRKTMFTLMIMGITICLYLWNYSSLSYSTKDPLPVIVSPLSIHTRKVHPQKHSDVENPAVSMSSRDVNIEDARKLIPDNVPHPTEAEIENMEKTATTPKKSVETQPVVPLESVKVEESKPAAAVDAVAAIAAKVGHEPVKTKPVPAAPAQNVVVPCPIKQHCASNQFSYYVKSGQGPDSPPVICYNNELVLGKGTSDQTYGRGANVVVIHPKFKTVMDRRTFDLYDSIDNCMEMAKYLSTYIPFKGQILMASFDDMTANLCKSVKTLLNQYGSSLIKDLKFRDNFVLVGEKGLPGNFGFEKKAALDGKEWPSGPVNVSGCATHPISPKYVDVDVINGYDLENCGVQKCGFDEIEIHIATVVSGMKAPKLCIGNSYIYYPGLKGSRGFNLVELDPLSKTVIKTAEYDTYQVESSRLELFLENVAEKNFLIAIVADDGSTSLKQHARDLLKNFGFNGDLITMRTALYFIGKRGMKITPVQKVSQPDTPKTWPAPINERFCLPTELSEATVQQVTNKARTEFCAKHDSFADFCFVHHKTEPLISASKMESYDSISEVYEVPILVLGGVNNIAMSHTLQSLLKQPGINKQNVFVAYSTMFGDDYKPFVKLFEFRHIEIKPISRYVDFLTAAFAKFWDLNASASYAIVIDDEIVAKPGFLWYMGHALKAMKKDSTIGAASAWNPQGFATVASDPSAVHVVSLFAGQAFMIPKSFYEQEIKGKEALCCSQRSIQQWFQSGTTQQYKYIVPEISRADYFSPTAYSAQTQPLSNLAMSMPRTAASLNLTIVPLSMDTVFNFDSIVTKNLKSAYYITEHDMTICKNSKEKGVAKLLTPFLPANIKNVAVVYSQTRVDDYSSLKRLYSCFGLMYMEGISPFGLYNGVTTVSLDSKRVYLVGTSSNFYKETVQSLHPYVMSF